MAIVTLQVLNGPRAGHRLSLRPHQEATVGRSAGAAFELADDATVSRLHFHLIHARPGRCWIVDPGSANGTYINGKRLAIGDVKDGDVITAGTTSFGVSVQDGTSVEPATPGSRITDCIRIRKSSRRHRVAEPIRRQPAMNVLAWDGV